MNADRRQMGLLGGVRNLAGVGSLLPVAVGAAGVGLFSRNRRAGVNFLTWYWPQLLLRINGVSLDVLGRENLTAQRPAVFIFNHRNNFDAAMTAALVRDNWTGVAKKELEKDPITGTLGKLLDTAFIDRGDAQSAVESLHKIEELASRGLSVLAAPEGTRVDTAGVGPFKKGPFRIAMSAGIPIVPIVIRNAEDVAPRNASTLNPGTVDIAVFPPIPTTDWTIRALPRRIAAVRKLYVDTLANWPKEPL
jgi:putative phosphoserine phosphatase / 1-acylglycerol-3-phosphate O-acyltransferase